MKSWYWAFFLYFALSASHAKSFGVVGEVFPIAEKSFLQLIHEKLQALEAAGTLKTMQQQLTNVVTQHIDRPARLALSRATRTSTHIYIPEVTLDQDIKDARNHILFTKGTHVNALQKLPSYQPCWLFFDADDVAQMHWVQQQACKNPKLILTGGAVSVAQKEFHDEVYFDQAGKITDKLHITHVPCKVVREHNHLRIVEQAIKENGDAL